LDELSVASTTILACTEPDPTKRPSASELSLIDLREGDSVPVEVRDTKVLALLQKLHDKDREIERCKIELEEKQRVIYSLEQEIHRMKNGSPSSIFTYPKPPSSNGEVNPARSALEESTSSSDCSVGGL
jgi:predicted DNA-binding antitoxin AbrB/MazE fold protein